MFVKSNVTELDLPEEELLKNQRAEQLRLTNLKEIRRQKLQDMLAFGGEVHPVATSFFSVKELGHLRHVSH